MFGDTDYSCMGRDGRQHFGGGGLGRDLQLIILLLLSKKPRRGDEIIKAVEEQSSGVYTPSPGMVYPAFTSLEEMGHAVAAARRAIDEIRGK